MAGFRLTPEADEDYVSIYVAGVTMFGIAQAERYADELDRIFALLAQFPRLERERTEIDPPIRAHPVRSHIVIYEIDDDDGIVILRIRHASEDWTSNSIQAG